MAGGEVLHEPSALVVVGKAMSSKETVVLGDERRRATWRMERTVKEQQPMAEETSYILPRVKARVCQSSEEGKVTTIVEEGDAVIGSGMAWTVPALHRQSMKTPILPAFPSSVLPLAVELKASRRLFPLHLHWEMTSSDRPSD